MFIITCLACGKVVDAHNAVKEDCQHYHTEERAEHYKSLAAK